MGAIASQITSLTIVYSIVYSDADQRKHQSSASLAFVWGIHRGPVNFPHKWPVTRKMFPFDDVIMSVKQWGCNPSACLCFNFGLAKQLLHFRHELMITLTGNNECNCLSMSLSWSIHGDVIKWKHFPRYWPFMRGIHRSSVNSPHKGQ